MPRNQTFGDLLKAGISSIVYCEGKTAPVIEEDLGQLVGVGAGSIQRYKAGNVPPELRTIEILAEACVSRGFLGRPWLERFLHAARHPASEKLLERLCPLGPTRLRPERVYENLPAPTYSQFVMREVAFAEVLDGLRQRSAAVLIVGLGGNGKTSLAREVAAHCLREDEDAPRFDAAVWVSDKDRPGTTNLSIVLDEIARTLDYPGFTQFEHEEKRREVEQLLRRQRVLLVVDNFETITDGTLLTWLLRLPEPSKVIITTREYWREFRRGGWPVELRGMSEVEVWELISERARVLKIEQLLGDQHLLKPLVVATGGNPKALTMAIGLVKYERRSLPQVVDDLYAARGELFDDLFARAWALLDEAARRVLLVATFFPTSASGEALRASADVQGFAFDRAVEKLADLALLDVQQVDLSSSPRYALHSLVRAFAGAKLTELSGFEQGARERWVEWYVQLVIRTGSNWYDLRTLIILDPELDNVDVVLHWTSQHQQFTETLRIGNLIGYYYYIQGLWDRHLTVNTLQFEAAKQLSDMVEIAHLAAHRLKVLSLQGNFIEAVHQVEIIQQALPMIQDPKKVCPLQHALAMNAVARQDLHSAQQLFHSTMQLAEQSANAFMYNRSRNWLADSLYQQGDHVTAERLFRETLEDSTRIDYQRSITFCQLKLAQLQLDQLQLDYAEVLLKKSSTTAYEFQNRREIGLVQQAYARLHALRGNIPAARIALTEAIDLFERLGMRRELAKARQALTDLETRAAQLSDAAHG